MTQAHRITLRVLSSNGIHGALARLGQQFECDSGPTLELSFDTANALATCVQRGERRDVAIVTAPLLEALAHDGITGGVRALARSGAGAKVPATSNANLKPTVTTRCYNALSGDVLSRRNSRHIDLLGHQANPLNQTAVGLHVCGNRPRKFTRR